MKNNIKNIHMIGIGGSGMSGIAEVLLNLGYTITGSDPNTQTNSISRLKTLGAMISEEHKKENISNFAVDVVVISSAISLENPEVLTAKEMKIPIISRAQMLSELMRFHYGVAVAGTHGKTTTTSLLSHVLAVSGLDPTFVIGGILNSTSSNAKLGKGKHFIVEADESDGSFLLLNPCINIITNIDKDHLQTYENDFEKLKKAFVDFTHKIPFYGTVIACIDDDGVRDILSKISRKIITYGFSADADIQCIERSQNGWKNDFTILIKKCSNKEKDKKIKIKLNLPGKHNVLNSLAVITAARELGVNFKNIKIALDNFSGVGRRMQIHGDLHFNNGKRTLLIEDYGHHPAEIAATMEALKSAWPDRKIILVFQPHRYSRTQSLFDKFVLALSNTDQLVLLEIYPAGEHSIANITSQNLLNSIRKLNKIDPIFAEDLCTLPELLSNISNDGDIILLQGAGNIGSISKILSDKFGKKDNSSHV